MEHYYHLQDGENWFNYENFYSFIVDNLNNNSKIVEVGSWLGRSISYFVVESINKQKNINCYCVDIWSPYEEIQTHHLFDGDNAYNTFIKNIEPIKDFVTPLRGKSLEISKKFEDYSLDFIFIDAAHDYQSVLDDVTYWYPKLKENCIIAGHDYYYGNDVYRAVNDFFSSKKSIDINGPCWYVKK